MLYDLFTLKRLSQESETDHTWRLSYLVQVYEKLFRSMSTKLWWLCIIVAANVYKISVRLAASRPLFLCRLAASQMKFLSWWPPAAFKLSLILFYFCKRLAATLGQIA
jgi:hypothetical protein